MRIALVFLLLFTSCSWRPKSAEYRHYYSYLKDKPSAALSELPSKCVIFYVSARHLDYSTPNSFLQTLCKHPSDGSTNGDVGHAWVQLHCESEDLIAGHSGETGDIQPKFFDGILELAAIGDQNPVRYLWVTQYDGFLQRGSGGHTPTFAALKTVSDSEYEEIKKLFFRSSEYWKEYRLTDRHCVNFVKEVAAVAHIELVTDVEVRLPNVWSLGDLWCDPMYSKITLATPDALEKSLIDQVRIGNLTVWKVPGYKPVCDLNFNRVKRVYSLRSGMSRSK